MISLDSATSTLNIQVIGQQLGNKPLLTLRMKASTEKGSWWLTGLKFTNRA